MRLTVALTIPMMTLMTTLVTAAPALAEGDAAKGEDLFKRCRSCHTITSPDGEAIVKGGRTGPNLYGLPGRAPASVEGFRYSDGLHQLAASEGGEVWTESLFEEYVADPTGFLRAHLGNNSVRSPMSYRLASGAEDMWAYLVSVSPEAAPAE